MRRNEYYRESGVQFPPQAGQFCHWNISSLCLIAADTNFIVKQHCFAAIKYAKMQRTKKCKEVLKRWQILHDNLSIWTTTYTNLMFELHTDLTTQPCGLLGSGDEQQSCQFMGSVCWLLLVCQCSVRRLFIGNTATSSICLKSVRHALNVPCMITGWLV